MKKQLKEEFEKRLKEFEPYHETILDGLLATKFKVEDFEMISFNEKLNLLYKVVPTNNLKTITKVLSSKTAIETILWLSSMSWFEEEDHSDRFKVLNHIRDTLTKSITALLG